MSKWVIKNGDNYLDDVGDETPHQKEAHRFTDRPTELAPGDRVVKLVPKTADYVCFIPAYGYVTELRPSTFCPPNHLAKHDSEKALVFDNEAADLLAQAWNKWVHKQWPEAPDDRLMRVLPC